MNLNDVRWIAIMGNPKLHGNKIEYVPPPPVASLVQGAPPNYATAKSNIEFDEGSVRVRVRLEGPDSSFNFWLGHGTDRGVLAGLNMSSGAYGIFAWQIPSAGTGSASPTSAPGPQVFVGLPSTLPIGRDVIVQLDVIGSRIKLLVEGVEVCALNAEVPRSQLVISASGSAPTSVELLDVARHQPTAFVVMQFSPEFNALYEEVIKPTCERFGYRAHRADDIFSNGLIIEDIAQSIKSASVIVADITSRNPNVFYEVGFAHAISKPTILMAEKKLGALPFDVAAFRAIFYEDSIAGKRRVEEGLSQHLSALSGRSMNL